MKKIKVTSLIIFITFLASIQNIYSQDSTKISAREVINNYIKAIGGKANLDKVKDRTTIMTGSVAGTKVRLTIYQKAPNLLKQESKVGSLIQDVYYDGKHALIIAAGKKLEITGSELEQLKYQSTLNMILDLKSLGIKLKYIGLKKVDDKNAYEIEMILPSGSKWIQYYDVKTGLKFKEVKFVITASGKTKQVTYFGKYKKVKDVLYPFSIKQKLGPQNLEFKVLSIDVNANLSKSIFEP